MEHTDSSPPATTADLGVPVPGASVRPQGAGLVRLQNVQALRGVAALAVVIAHIASPTGFEAKWLTGDRSWLGWLDPVGQAGVDLFFVISGLIMVVTTAKMSQGLRSAGAFGARRLLRIFPPYWLATLPVLVLFLAAPEMVNSSSAAPPRVLESFLLLPQPGLPLLLVGWTLTFELYFYLVFAVTLLLPRRFRALALLVWGAGTAAVALAVPATSNVWLNVLSAPLCLEFLFGAAVGWLVLRRADAGSRLATVLGAAGVVAALTLGNTYFPGNWYRVVPVALLLAVLVYGVVGLEQRQVAVAPRWAQAVGDASYSMYLLHVLILTALGRFVLVRLPDGVAYHAGGLLVSLAVVVAGSLLAYRLVESPLMRFLHPKRLAGLAGRARRPDRVSASSSARSRSSAPAE